MCGINLLFKIAVKISAIYVSVENQCNAVHKTEGTTARKLYFCWLLRENKINLLLPIVATACIADNRKCVPVSFERRGGKV